MPIYQGCYDCGYSTSESFNYCPNCGSSNHGNSPDTRDFAEKARANGWDEEANKMVDALRKKGFTVSKPARGSGRDQGSDLSRW